MTEEIKKFIEAFFISMNAKVDYEREGRVAVVSGVSEVFEKFYGKKAPYYLVFDNSLNGQIENGELMTRGSFLINCIKEFLSSRGETTLIKMDFDQDPRAIIEKMFIFKNCMIEGINRKIEYKYIIRFSFQTTFQYLNEQENVINDLYVKEGEVINFDNEKFHLVQGKKEEFVVKDIREDYGVAKSNVKPLLEKRINELGAFLDNKLKKELERIKQHFSSQLQEYTDVLEKNNKQIEELKKQLEKARLKNNSAEVENINSRIEKIKEINRTLGDNKKVEQAKTEEAFFIKDEIQKHSLNLDTKLINTSIIYYPVYTYATLIKGIRTGASFSSGVRTFEVKHNPFEEKITGIHCEHCKKQINEINLCSSGHINCRVCLRGCSECGADYCIGCLDKECFSCGKKLCKKCAKKCISCGKYKCKVHMKTLSKCLSCSEKSVADGLSKRFY